MGTLFELLAQLLGTFAAEGLAQLGADGAAAEQPPAVQRTVLSATPKALPKAISREAACPERARLQTA